MTTRGLSFSLCLVLAGMLLLEAQDAAKPAEAPKLRALIVTGEDVPAHNWRETTPVTREILEAGERFEVRVCEDIDILETKSIHRYDVLILNFRNNTASRDISDAAKQNLLDYVASGKGLVALHFAVAAFQNWREYRDLVGRVWVGKVSGHGPRGPFKAEVVSKDHPVTSGLENFEIDDELYANLEGERPIQALVKAHSGFSQKDEALVWTVERDKGRVLCISLGHDARARRNPSFAALLKRGAEWAATGSVKGQ